MTKLSIYDPPNDTNNTTETETVAESQVVLKIRDTRHFITKYFQSSQKSIEKSINSFIETEQWVQKKFKSIHEPSEPLFNTLYVFTLFSGSLILLGRRNLALKALFPTVSSTALAFYLYPKTIQNIYNNASDSSA
jgi:hypothetical protein